MALNYRSALMTIGSSNFDLLVNFYKTLLDQMPIFVIPGIYAEFHLAGLKLGIFRPQESAKESNGGVAYQRSHSQLGMGLCLEVASLEAAIAHLEQLGYPPEPIRHASHGREVDAQDPDGNWLILHQSP